MRVRRQPDVVLRDEELQADAAEPGEEAGVAGAEEAEQVAEQDEADDLERMSQMEFKKRLKKKNYFPNCVSCFSTYRHHGEVRVYLVALDLPPAVEGEDQVPQQAAQAPEEHQGAHGAWPQGA